MSPGISFSASSISLRPQAASETCAGQRGACRAQHVRRRLCRWTWLEERRGRKFSLTYGRWLSNVVVIARGTAVRRTDSAATRWLPSARSDSLSAPSQTSWLAARRVSSCSSLAGTWTHLQQPWQPALLDLALPQLAHGNEVPLGREAHDQLRARRLLLKGCCVEIRQLVNL